MWIEAPRFQLLLEALKGCVEGAYDPLMAGQAPKCKRFTARTLAESSLILDKRLDQGRQARYRRVRAEQRY